MPYDSDMGKRLCYSLIRNVKRRAIATADLVPVFSFGENDVSILVTDEATVQFLMQ